MHTSRILSTLLFGGLFALGAACSGVDDVGSTNESEDELSASQRAACDGKACGDACSICNGRPGCVETMELKVCGGDGKCTSRPSTCEALDAGPAPAPACAGKACGEPCTICNGRPGCVETMELKFCGGDGTCSGRAPACDAQDAGPAPACAGKACGERCSTCTGDVCPAVVEACDAKGACTTANPVCPAVDAGPAYAPCGGKLCGDPCTLCRPGDASCFETAVLKFCQADGKSCQPSVPACGI